MKLERLLLIILSSFVALGTLASPCEGQVLKQPGLPFEIDGSSLHMNRVTKEVNFNFKLANRTSDPLRQIVLTVLVKNAKGNPLAFQRSVQKVDVAPGTEKRFTLRLSNLLYVDPVEGPVRFAAAIEGARTEGAAWTQSLSPLEFMTALRAGGFVPVNQAPVGAFQEAGCEGICLECAQLAKCLCGSGSGVTCVKDFNCSKSTCECSFTCTNSSGCQTSPCSQ